MQEFLDFFTQICRLCGPRILLVFYFSRFLLQHLQAIFYSNFFQSLLYFMPSSYQEIEPTYIRCKVLVFSGFILLTWLLSSWVDHEIMLIRAQVCWLFCYSFLSLSFTMHFISSNGLFFFPFFCTEYLSKIKSNKRSHIVTLALP